MAYSTEAQVESELKGTTFESSGTTISSTEIGEFIDISDEMIDSYIANRYTVPVSASATKAAEVLRHLSVALTKAKVMDILEFNQTGGTSEKATQLRSDAITMLEKISRGEVLLSDAGSALPVSSSYNYEQEIDPTFEVGSDQW